jgi:hypothetical protein
MIKVQGMYKHGDNDRKFVSCYLKSYEYACYECSKRGKKSD